METVCINMEAGFCYTLGYARYFATKTPSVVASIPKFEEFGWLLQQTCASVKQQMCKYFYFFHFILFFDIECGS